MNEKSAKELRRMIRIGTGLDPLREEAGRALYRRLKKKYRRFVHGA